MAGGVYHTCAILASGAVKCWGWNEAGRLGHGDRLPRGYRPTSVPEVDLGTGRTAVSLIASWNHSCAILDNGRLKCWGGCGGGQCGIAHGMAYGDEPGEMGDALPPADLGTGRTARQLAAGENFTCALLDNGQVKCWGWNRYGQLGLGDSKNRGDEPGEMGDALPPVDLGTGRTARAIAAGRDHVCALLDNGSVKCWGQNVGQLGLGDSKNRGDEPGEMGDALPPVDLGTGRTARAIAAGGSHSCALLDNGQVKCWGMNFYGELGLGDSKNRGDEPGEMGDALPPVDLGTGRTARGVFAGSNWTCALLDDATLKCWGGNTLGQLGQGTQNNLGNMAGQMGDALKPVPLGTGRTVRTVYAGYNHLCARLDNDAIKCWGWNAYGQLGLGDTNSRGDQPGEMGDALPALMLGP
ncbi:MAG: hypothetical protein RMK29_22200 [Myxococcales bacterium]|nr:hypothetical protein [Myxococcota bacterium]MDW8284428.1 hypothetical protein [Myxococcales bacterium]